MAWLALARLLIRHVRFRRWRATLGEPCAAEVVTAARAGNANTAPRRLACTVERACSRLPGESRCLARAMALQWMLRRRRLGGVIHIGVRAGSGRGRIDDLHAWVTRSGEVLIGQSPDAHRPLLAAANAFDGPRPTRRR